ncbi:SdpA family antimicrobial peptide system protein [Curtobacterium sp. GD1]|nr:SdpA family antimicrobial peptide system protein [Curtobacterium sp. GD1]
MSVVLIAYLVAMRVGPTAAVQLPAQGEANGVLSRVLPQGWAFFTKPTLSATPIGLKRVDGDWAVVAGVSNAQLRFVAGLSREGRRQGVEMASILNGVPESSWQQCEGRSPVACTKGHGLVPVSNTLRAPTLCGHVVLAGVKPIPWQWRGLVPGGTYVDEAIALEVSCAHP